LAQLKESGKLTVEQRMQMQHQVHEKLKVAGLKVEGNLVVERRLERQVEEAERAEKLKLAQLKESGKRTVEQRMEIAPPPAGFVWGYPTHEVEQDVPLSPDAESGTDEVGQQVPRQAHEKLKVAGLKVAGNLVVGRREEMQREEAERAEKLKLAQLKESGKLTVERRMEMQPQVETDPLDFIGRAGNTQEAARAAAAAQIAALEEQIATFGRD